jgi:hypothetical protein
VPLLVSLTRKRVIYLALESSRTVGLAANSVGYRRDPWYPRGRFWIASLIFDDERPGLTLPAKYLKKAGL